MPLDADLIARSLSLSEADRADLAHRLLMSLEPAVSESPQEVKTAWAAEIGRRVDQLDGGEVKMISWPEAEKRIRDALHRARHT